MSCRQAPIVIVGQPRSGSTITTRILNAFDSVFLINDFYALQAIDAEKLWHRRDPSSSARIAEIVLKRVAVRATQESGKTLEQSIELSSQGLAKVSAFARGDWPAGTPWYEVMGAVLTKAAQEAGCSVWGWNTPQDHLHLERIFNAWPEAQILFVMRDPNDVLRSYKNASGPWHDARRYNPATIGYAWRVAARNFRAWSEQRPGRVEFLWYESLVSDTEASVDMLSKWAGLPCQAIALEGFGNNSSHHPNRTSREVTDAEVWLAHRIIGQEIEKLGFLSMPKPSLSGIFHLTGVILRSSLFIGTQLFTDRDRRKRALNFLRG